MPREKNNQKGNNQIRDAIVLLMGPTFSEKKCLSLFRHYAALHQITPLSDDYTARQEIIVNLVETAMANRQKLSPQAHVALEFLYQSPPAAGQPSAHTLNTRRPTTKSKAAKK